MTDNIKSKIEKLLRLAESSNPHEAQLASQQAEKLMIKWGIEEAELQHRQHKSEEIVEVRRTYTGQFAISWVSFAHAVCNGLGGLQNLQSGGGNNRTFYTIGHKSDVDRAEMLLNSLELQAMHAEADWWSTYVRKYGMTSSEKYKTRRAFYISFAMEVKARLKDMRTAATQEAGTGTALVLVDRGKRVEAWVHQNRSVSARRGRGMDHSGAGFGAYAAGREAGRNASLGEKGLGGGRTALR